MMGKVALTKEEARALRVLKETGKAKMVAQIGEAPVRVLSLRNLGFSMVEIAQKMWVDVAMVNTLLRDAIAACQEESGWWSVYSTRTANCLRRLGFESQEQVSEALRSGEIAWDDNTCLFKGMSIQGFGKMCFREISTLAKIEAGEQGKPNTVPAEPESVRLWGTLFSKRTAECLRQLGFESLDARPKSFGMTATIPFTKRCG